MSRRTVGASLGACALGAAGMVLACVLEPRQAWNSYLIAYAFGLSTALGALLYLMTGHVTRARWFVVMRRPAEAVTATVPLFGILFVPLLLAAHYVWPWAAPLAGMNPMLRAAVEPKRHWLSLPFFAARSGVYLLVWVAVAYALLRLSRREDEERDGGAVALAVRQRVISAGAMPAVALTLTFAAFDWLMSLDPGWYSTVYGLYVFAGGYLAAIAAVTLLTFRAFRAGLLPREVSDDHFHAAGRVLLAMVVFWAYLAFFQYMLIWIADIPEEVRWVLARTRRGWGAWAVALAVAQFALPFAALLFRAVTRNPRRLALVSVWILAAHYVDLFWLLAPSLRPDRALPSWTDVAALLFVGGAGAALAAWRWDASPAVPLRDPNLGAALRYESP